MSDCENCGGTGKVQVPAPVPPGAKKPKKPQTVTANCFNCNGTGEICDICGEAINVCDGIHDDDEDDEADDGD